MDSWGRGSRDDGDWVRPGDSGRTPTRREPDPWESPEDRGSVPADHAVWPGARDEYVKPVRREAGYDTPRHETPTHETPTHDTPTHDTYDGYGYGDGYDQDWSLAPQQHADPTYRASAVAGRGFTPGWLPMWPTIGIAATAIILAFVIGRATGGGGRGDSASTSSASSTSTTTSTTAAPLTHTVARGETLGAIASQFAVDPAALATYNGITDPSRIFVGQVIKIPPKVP